MAEPGPDHGARSFERFWAMVARWWPLVLALTVLAAAVAVLIERSNDEEYVASADVYLTRMDLAGQFAGIPNTDQSQPVERWVQTQAELARVPRVAVTAVRQSDVEGATAAELLSSSTVTPHPNTDLLTFSVRNVSAQDAVALADAYAQSFVTYRRALDQTTIQIAIDDLEDQIASVTPPENASEQTLIVSLTAILNKLRGAHALQTSNSIVVRPAGLVGRVENKPLQAGLAGAAIGFVVGMLLLFLLEALSRRVRTEAELSHRLELPLLGRVPSRANRRRGGGALAMRDRPESAEAEVYRSIRAEVELAAAPDLRSIMIDAVDREAVDTPVIAANLAIALARSSTHTILVDVDLRHRALDELFAVTGRPGLTEVVAGRVDLDAALVTAWAGESVPFGAQAEPGEVMPDQGALLQLLPAGAAAASVGDLLASPRLHQVLADVAERAAVVVFHGPPIVGTADALTLCESVDGVIVVAGISQARRRDLDEVRQELAGVVDCLGVVVTGKGSAPAASLRGTRAVAPQPRTRPSRPVARPDGGATPLGVAHPIRRREGRGGGRGSSG